MCASVPPKEPDVQGCFPLHHASRIAHHALRGGPDTPAIQPGGDLVFTSSSLNDHFAGSVKPGQERYELWRLPLNVHSAKTK
ncbi:hypothetical protein AWV80_32810 [Cupriavidus sp. UYMU48A]|nr:hypothetical protein AWV80_32810 [Cupriavidus sp. UYMU48A]